MSSVLPRSRSTWWAKLLLAFAAPVLCLGGLELGLRLFDVGRNPAFFIPDHGQPTGTYRSNPRFTELFFPASFGLKPVNFRLTQPKPAATTRIFLIGESAAMGVPEPGFGMAPQLQALLRQAQPDRSIEVFNLGITAINSHAILPIVRQAVEFAPDLLVFYVGNNEIVGPYGPGSAITDSLPPLPLIRASIWVRSTRTGQLLQALIARLGAATASFREWGGMEMFAQKTVTIDDPQLAQAHRNFARNLEDMLRVATDAGVPSVLSTVNVNLRDAAPFASPAADATFQQARTQEINGDEAAAITHYVDALMQDNLRFRADVSINEIIRTAATNHPTVGLLENAPLLVPSPPAVGPIPGRQQFFEHVHLTFLGNAAIARSLATAAFAQLFPHEPTPTHWLDDAQLAAAIGFTPFGQLGQWQQMDTLVTRPPFTGQSTYAEDRTYFLNVMAHLSQSLNDDALTAAERTIAQARQSDPQSAFLVFHAAQLASQRGDHAKALKLLAAHDRLAPTNAESIVLRAFAIASQQRVNEAIDLLRDLTITEPFYYPTYTLLSAFFSGTGQLSRGIDTFAALIERLPSSRTIQIEYANLLSVAGRHDEANTWRLAVLKTVPDDEGALLPLIEHAFSTDRVDEALALMLAAHAYNPRNATNNDLLVQVYQQRGDRANTLRFMRDLIASGPVSDTLRQAYQTLLESEPPPAPVPHP